ncbi:MAG: hypothetical protein KDN22_25230 [Verrucomicrobiae bacterium]|nr:hypothetical protein [Verrucomicrobiae bacterium]
MPVALAICAIVSSCSEHREGTAEVGKKFEGIEQKQERGPLQVIVRVSPKEPTIADKIELALEVTVDEDYAVDMPTFGEKLEQFGIRDFSESQPKLVDGNRMQTVRTYELEPFLSGDYEIPPMKFSFARKSTSPDAVADASEEHTLETEPLKLTVRSLLDENKASLVIHEIAPPVSLEKPGIAGLGAKIGGGIAALALIAGAAIWLVRRKKKEVFTPLPVPAHELAFQQLEQLVADDLPRKGEIKMFYQRISDILRRYIENRFGLHAPEQTTEEFLAELRSSPKLPPVYQVSLREFLQHCDLVKFADHSPTTEDIQRTFDSCKHFIIETQSEASTVAEETPQPAAAQT